MRKVLLLITVLALSLIPGCSMNYSVEEDETGVYGISKDDCFLGYVNYAYEGQDNITIILPDEYNGVPVTRLGGYFGRGVPTPFYVALKNGDEWLDFSSSVKEDDEYVEMTINIIIGENIKEFKYVKMFTYFGTETNDKFDATVKVTYIFEIDDNNKYLYSNDGKVYDKNTNEEIKYLEE